jgi:ketosteroid isomerase-like protein
MTGTEVVNAFFDAYRAHDVEGMVDLCADNADLNYVPVESWRRQWVVRGDGKVGVMGKILWTGLIDAFPDLTNEVHRVIPGSNGSVAAEVTLKGTQARDWGTIGNQGGHYELEHLFVFDLDEDSRIKRISGYWDGAWFFEQLGRVEVD